MNLLTDPWVPTDLGIRTPAGALAAGSLAWARSDFDAGFHQFLIGLLQTAVVRDPNRCPDESTWRHLRQAPPTDLGAWLTPLAHAFELFGPQGFLQEFGGLQGDTIPIASLLPETPGDNTIKKCADLVRWSHTVPHALSLPATAMALYADATFGVRWGRGHRQGIRGENRWTTLVVPDRPHGLWERVWLNVLPYRRWLVYNRETPWDDALVFPWLAPTRTSEAGQAVTPDDVHPLQVHWPMPRRVRLGPVVDGVCGVTGVAGPTIAQFTRTYNGANYDAWRHPLSPYLQTSKGEQVPLPISQTHIGYDAWAGLALMEYHGVSPAVVVNEYVERRATSEDVLLRLHCSGWMEGNEGRQAWVEDTVPLIVSEDREVLAGVVTELLDEAGAAQKALGKALKGLKVLSKGAGRGPSDAIFARTETEFYRRLRDRNVEGWAGTLRSAAVAVFDETVERTRVDPLRAARERARL